MGPLRTFTAFIGADLLEAGPIEPVVRAVKEVFDRRENTPPVLVFEDATGKQVDFDLEGSPDLVVERLGWHPLFRNPEDLYPKRTGPGRPRLGVVSREISLFPRHWEWLERQPQGASAAIRRLVEEALAHDPDQGKARRSREAAGTFMWAMAGNLVHFEEASRVLYAGDEAKLEELMQAWPRDVRDYVKKLLEG